MTGLHCQTSLSRPYRQLPILKRHADYTFQCLFSPVTEKARRAMELHALRTDRGTDLREGGRGHRSEKSGVRREEKKKRIQLKIWTNRRE